MLDKDELNPNSISPLMPKSIRELKVLKFDEVLQIDTLRIMSHSSSNSLFAPKGDCPAGQGYLMQSRPRDRKCPPAVVSKYHPGSLQVSDIADNSPVDGVQDGV